MNLPYKEKSMERAKRNLVTEALESIEDVATLPEVTVKIIEIVDNDESRPEELYEVINHDPALVSRVLKVVNSAFYGLPGQVSNIERAISLLGLAAIKNIALASSMGKMFKSGKDTGLFNAMELWEHSLAVAIVAKKIGDAMGRHYSSDELFMTGLIHDIGLIAEAQIFPDKVSRVCEVCSSGENEFLQAEEEIIGATHQDFGNLLTLKWRFPTALRTAISCHHSYRSCDDGIAGELAAILYCADTFCCSASAGFSLTAAGQELSPGLFDTLKINPEQLKAIQDGLAEDLEDALAVFSSDD